MNYCKITVPPRKNGVRNEMKQQARDQLLEK